MIEKLELKNWKSHHDNEFSFSSGVNVLVGEMGSGKSSILEAISFALFGTTPALKSRTITLDNLIRRNPSPADQATVKLSFSIGGDTYKVKRIIERDKGTKEAELRKNGSMVESPSPTKVTNNIEKILDMDYDLFSRAVYSEQNNLDYFLNMRSGERKKKIDELLKLHKFEGARKNTVKVKNIIDGRRESKESDLRSLSESEKLDEIPELKEEIENLEEKVEAKEEGLNEKEEKLEGKKRTYRNLKEREEKFEKLKEKKTKLESELESSKKRIDKRRAEIEAETSEFSAEDVDNKLRELDEKLEKFEEYRKGLNSLKEKYAEKKSLRDRTKEDLKELEENKEKCQELSEVSEKLKEKREDLTSMQKNIQDLSTKIENLNEHIEPLKEGADECPVCGSNLNEEKRENLLNKREKSKEDMSDKRESLLKQAEKLKQKIEDLEKNKEELSEFSNIDEKIEAKKKEFKRLNTACNGLKEDIKSQKEKLESIEREKIKEVRDEFKNLKEIKVIEDETSECKEKLEYIEEKIEDLEFKREKLERVQEEKNELQTDLKVLKNDIKSQREILEEKKKRLTDLNRQKDRIKKLEKEMERYDLIIDFLTHFEVALEETQIGLRERFIGSLNDIMDEIWQKVYPYDDYSTIRLNVDEDYILELLDEEKEWIPVEGEVSGGERHTAALALRISLALILSPRMKVLILDEPTHNLDSRAIEDLGDTMKEKVSDLVDQLFLITHEEGLESAVTGEFYKLTKKNTDTGLTEILERNEM